MNIRVDKIAGFINEASNVIVVAHKNLDLDALGSSLGIYYIIKALGKEAYLLIEDESHEMSVARALKELKEKDVHVKITTLENVEDVIDNKTSLIIVDVNNKELIQNPGIFERVSNIMIIDHHDEDSDTIKNTKYKCIIEEESSTAEIVSEILQGLNMYIPPYVATVMLAGIFIDTGGFFQKTTHRTYLSAAYLDRQGASQKDLQHLLKEDLQKYIERQKIISQVEIINQKIAIGLGKENHVYHTEELAKVSDVLLQFDDIEVAFTIAHIDSNTIGISARSFGNIDVQMIMEELGGGGNETDAATQIKDLSLIEIKDKLLNLIYNMKL